MCREFQLLPLFWLLGSAEEQQLAGLSFVGNPGQGTCEQLLSCGEDP